MRGLKTLLLTKTWLATALFAFGTVGILAPVAKAQICVNIGVQPVCSYGYYDYAPYACAPVGFYGSGYFYNGIFLGMGPWAGWGYGHGWGGHRFVNDGGGRYHGGGGAAAGRAYANGGGREGRPSPGRVERGGEVHGREGGSHVEGGRPNAAHAQAPHAAPRAEASHVAPHASAPHAAPRAAAAHGGGGGAPHGGAPHGGGGAVHGGGGGAPHGGEHK
jgi:hypothetical protein